MTPKPPTPRQLNYLKALANRTGQTFTYPRTSAQASAEIHRLKGIRATGFTFAELQAENAAREAHGDLACSVQGFEVTGYNSSATWSQRS
ncbi:MAG TPA: hypothetical protein VME22_12905 [Solirubrobacteraceae bacterium]|nr:hypothetical protein [Solirubrobacteraceae bacterium]